MEQNELDALERAHKEAMTKSTRWNASQFIWEQAKIWLANEIAEVEDGGILSQKWQRKGIGQDEKER